MHKYTQQEFYLFPVIDGIKQCPSGDYSGFEKFAEGCSFAERCSFAEGCSLEAGKKMVGNSIYSCGGMGSEGRTTYGIPTKEGVFVRCGCWFGNLSEFRDRAKEVYGDSEISVEYGIVADLFEARWKREVGR